MKFLLAEVIALVAVFSASAVQARTIEDALSRVQQLVANANAKIKENSSNGLQRLRTDKALKAEKYWTLYSYNTSTCVDGDSVGTPELAYRGGDGECVFSGVTGIYYSGDCSNLEFGTYSDSDCQTIIGSTITWNDPPSCLSDLKFMCSDVVVSDGTKLFNMYEYDGACTDGDYSTNVDDTLYFTSGVCKDSKKMTCSSDAPAFTWEEYDTEDCTGSITNAVPNQAVDTCLHAGDYPVQGRCYGSEDKVDKAVCFAGSETLLLESGSLVAMKDVSIGDKVQVAAVDGSLFFANVIFLPHEKNSQLSTFLEITTSNGASLKTTPSHLVMSGACGSNHMRLIRAEDISIGDCLDTISGEDVVIASTKTQGEGIYTVVTSHTDGIIVVNGFKASSFAINHALANNYYHVHRILSAYAPVVMNALIKLNAVVGFLASSFLAVYSTM